MSEPRKRSTLRGLLGVAFILGFGIAAGSYIMREEVISALSDRAGTAASVVLTHPYVVRSEVSLDGSRLLDRLKRLRYRNRKIMPESPGEFMLNSRSLNIYLRKFALPDGDIQEATLVRIALDKKRILGSITDVASRQKLPYVRLEPEYLSQLGTSATRAVTPKTLNEFPKHLIDAVISIEDERFYHHFGLDPLAILRALYTNLKSGGVVQGGSTITQQLAKNLFFSSKRTISRKLYEAVSALLIETAFTKEQILEFYLNEIFLGQEGRVALHGFGEAALSFFEKDVKDISLAEAATLAGIIKAPSSYSPRFKPKAAHKRRRIVLNKMFERGLITESVLNQALEEKLQVKKARRLARPAAYFIDHIRKDLQKSIPSGKLVEVHTGLDMEYQRCAESAVRDGLNTIEKQYRGLEKIKEPLQAALIAIDPVTGIVRAWVGGRDYAQNQFDRVSQARRQPGSAFKPFVYLTALDSSLNNYRTARTTSLLADEPLSLSMPGGDIWNPQNYDRKFRGEVTLREALTKSLNIPTVNLALKVGVDKVAATARLFGFGDELPEVPSLALGAGEVSPLQLARAYAAIANGGMLASVRAIISVSSKDEILHENPSKLERAATEPATFVLTNILRSVIESGTGQVIKRQGFLKPAAGKTGTSNDGRDSWFAGYTPRLLAVVWVGYDSNKAHGLTGSQAAAPIWADFMMCASSMEPTLSFIPPPDVIYKKVDTDTGLLAVKNCPSSRVITEVFVKGADPITPCSRHSYKKRETLQPPPVENRAKGDFWDSLFGY